MNQLRKDFTIAFQLSAVSRYSRDHMLKPENVLEHIGFCAFYSLLLASRLEKAGNEIDFGKLFRRVAVHDLDEAVLGDIPRTTKYFSEAIREAFSVVENISIRQLGKWFGFDFIDDWKDAKKGLEGQILKVTDIAGVVYKNWVEIKMLQNRSFLRVALETQKTLVEMDTRNFPELLKQEILELHNLNLETLNSFPAQSEDYIFLHMKAEKCLSSSQKFQRNWLMKSSSMALSRRGALLVRMTWSLTFLRSSRWMSLSMNLPSFNSN